jgi:hypothetical protein
VRLVESSVEDEDDIPMEVDGKDGPSEMGRKGRFNGYIFKYLDWLPKTKEKEGV